jgi:hypothetical protein
MSRNLCRTNCRTCESEVIVCGVPYRGSGLYQEGMWIADAICTVCETKYTAWIGPSQGSYGGRECDRRLLADHGFYDLSYRSTFNDEPGTDDLPTEKVETFRVVKIGNRQIWFETQ